MSLNKKQSSTYIKYACGCFLYAPSIYLASLQKGFWYTAQKLILNVSEAARMPLVPRSRDVFCFTKNSLSSNRHGCLLLDEVSTSSIFVWAVFTKRVFPTVQDVRWFKRSSYKAVILLEKTIDQSVQNARPYRR